jgi:tryptophanyl-tRNA synthetase
MSLDDPTKKMSKSSSNENSYIALTDDPKAITRKIKRAVTDSGSTVTGGDDKPALTNLIGIYALFSDQTPAQVEAAFEGQGYGAFKQALADLLIEKLEPIQTRLAELQANPEIALGVLENGANQAREHAARTMAVARERMGLVLRS